MSRFCFTLGGSQYCIPVLIRRDWLWPIPPEDPFVVLRNPGLGGPPPVPLLEGAVTKEVVEDLSTFATLVEVANLINDKDVKGKMMATISELSGDLKIPEGFSFKIASNAKLRNK
jgi:hypothetical protein